MNRFTGWLDADAIATCTCEGLVEQFGCAFARIWLVERDGKALRLVASAGLYTRLDGSFARVPMGSFKVGKIAQHCIPFLSNALPEEKWVKDRDWAIENRIQGFAGLPLMAQGQAIGVLAVFSQRVMAAEFLEVLQMLSLSVAGALASALNHQSVMKSLMGESGGGGLASELRMTLSERLAAILGQQKLGQQKLSLLGVEQPIDSAVAQLLVRLAEGLAGLACHYCRLVYGAETVALEAMLAADRLQIEDRIGGQFGGQIADQIADPTNHRIDSETDYSIDPLDSQADRVNSSSFFGQLFYDFVSETEALGGMFHSQMDLNKTVVEVRVQLPQWPQRSLNSLLLKSAMLKSAMLDPELSAPEVLEPVSIQPVLSELAQRSGAGKSPLKSPLSEREQEVMALLAGGSRDREISEQLFISERTVKFHTKNMLAKLGVRTRTQAVFEATKQGWL
jgi:DNA-binding CsgD family transcriptional regulator